MKNKKERLHTIQNIIASTPIGSQEELLGRLREEGYELTQATLSRDLKQLQIAKVGLSDGGYAYVLPEKNRGGRIASDEAFGTDRSHAKHGYLSLEFSGQLAVLKTKPGYAGGLAYDIDNTPPMEIIGTIAGDDTILLILREGVTRQEVRKALSRFIPALAEAEF